MWSTARADESAYHTPGMLCAYGHASVYKYIHAFMLLSVHFYTIDCKFLFILILTFCL